MVKNYLFNILLYFIIIFISSIIVTLLNYFNILPNKLISTLKLIIPIISIFISSLMLGKKCKKKGYIEGLKFGCIIIVLIFAISLIFKSFNIKLLIFYFILLLSSTLGSMIGITRKKDS